MSRPFHSLFSSLSLAFGSAISLFWLASCGAGVTGSGNVVSETRAVGGFHAVELASVGDVTITSGDKEELVVEAEDNLLPLITSEVKPDGTLVIGTSGAGIRPTKPIHYKLLVRTLDKIVLSGSGSIGADKMTADRCAIQLPGSGGITIRDMETGTLALDLEGSGKIKLGGHAGSQKVELSGSGDYDASALKTESAAISLSGSGECKVWAGEVLKVEISGSGTVDYYGNPKVSKSVTGSGAVHGLGEKGI